MNAQRSTTSVPQQALYMMNSPFVIAQAEALTDAPDFSSTSPEERQVQMLYERVLARKATPAEVKTAIEYVRSAEATPRTAPVAAWQYGYGNFDASTRKVTFTPLPHWNGLQWQCSPKLPDAKLGWVHINAAGGHPSLALAAIRRFTAPRDMTLSLAGELQRPQSDGDGVLGRIVTARQGQLAEFDVKPAATVPTALAQIVLKANETLDFIVESRGNDNSDSFRWRTMLRTTDGATFDAANQFTGLPPKTNPFTPWERFAQVLMETNEFMFVD
jgi:hypothetical protein